MNLPPVDAQRAIKRFFSKHRRFGGYSDLARLFANDEFASELAEYGVTAESLTSAQFEQIMRGGIWDGWVRMVESNGEFPTGLLSHVQRALSLRANAEFTLVDERAYTRGERWGTVPLYDYQREAVDAFLTSGRGVVDLPPRSGKTRIAVAVAAELGVPALYVAPNIGIVEQTAAVFTALLPHKSTIALHGKSGRGARAMRRVNNADVIITTPQTALKVPNIHTRGLLIFDEFHHAAAKTWHNASKYAAHAYWRLGLTGTHFRADGRDMEMAAVLGSAIYRQTVGEMVELGRLVPARIAMLRIRGNVDAGGYDAYREGVVDCRLRNETLAAAANTLVKHGRRVLVLCKEIAHAQTLASMIPGAQAVDGSDNDRVKAMLDALAAGTVSAVVGTSVIGEGRDVPAADALVYASGGRSKVRVVQDYFRALTASAGKRVAIVVDAADAHNPILLDHAAARLSHYREERAFDACVIEPNHFQRWLNDAD
jgi:superfamily II DNA or RNA helicase